MSMITTAEAARRLGVTRRNVQDLVKRRKLRAIRFGNQLSIGDNDLVAMVEAFRANPPERCRPPKWANKTRKQLKGGT